MSKIRRGYVLENKERRGLAKQAMLFVLPRIPCTILGTIVGSVFPVAFAYVSARLNLDHFALITTLGGILGAFVYKLVLTWGVREYKVAEVAVINSKLERGIVPDPVFKGGLTLAHTYFESVTFGYVFINLAKALYRNIFKGMKNEYPIGESFHTFWIGFRDAVLIFIADLFPYLGICSIYNVFTHTELTTVRAIGRGAKNYLKHFFKMILRNIMNAIEVIFIFTLSFCVLLIVMIIVCGLLPELTQETIKIMEYAKMTVDYANTAIIAPAFLAGIISVVIVLLSQPMRVTLTLERYKVISDRDNAKNCDKSSEVGNEYNNENDSE